MVSLIPLLGMLLEYVHTMLISNLTSHPFDFWRHVFRRNERVHMQYLFLEKWENVEKLSDLCFCFWMCVQHMFIWSEVTALAIGSAGFKIRIPTYEPVSCQRTDFYTYFDKLIISTFIVYTSIYIATLYSKNITLYYILSFQCKDKDTLGNRESRGCWELLTLICPGTYLVPIFRIFYNFTSRNLIITIPNTPNSLL